MTELLSPKNPLAQHIRLLLRDRKEREETGLAVLEGVRLAEEAVRAGLKLEYALFTADLAAKERGAELLAQLAGMGVALYEVAPTTLERLADTQTPQGILAVFHTPVWALAQIRPGLVILLDNLQDPGNLGTIIRSLEAMGGAGLAIAGGVDPYNPKVVRSAMGSLFRLPLVTGDAAALIDGLRAQGRTIYVADAGGSLTPWTADLKGSSVLVIGNEGAGPSDAARQMADGVISIPMPGPTESLNAGVAASLLIYEAMRQQMGLVEKAATL